MRLQARHLRIAVSSIVAALAAAGFAGARSPLPQMGPAALRAVATGAGSAISIALAFVILTLLFGRIYCAAACPLGILQDFIGWLTRRKGRLDKNRRKLRYAIMVATAGLLMAGWVLPARILEPFTLAGRIFAGVFAPLYAAVARATGWGNNAAQYTITGAAMVAGLIILTLLAILVLRRNRVFCTSVCPVGTLLGLCARVGLLRLEMQAKQCNHCGKCARACPAGCIDVKSGTIDNERCLRCMNCTAVCSASTIVWRRAVPAAAPSTPATSADPLTRRKFFRDLGTTALVSFGAGHLLRPGGLVPLRIRSRIYPPGAGSLQRFASKCTNCLQCVGVCEGKVIVPPDTTSSTVHLDYTRGMCEFNCSRCGQVCPTGALVPLALAKKKRLRIGMAFLHERRCIAIVEGIHCGACAEHCPTGALRMVSRQGHTCPVPELNGHLCIGCGNCSLPCPVRPYRAMTVSPVALQTLADDPEEYFRDQNKNLAPPPAAGDEWLI